MADLWGLEQTRWDFKNISNGWIIQIYSNRDANQERGNSSLKIPILPDIFPMNHDLFDLLKSNMQMFGFFIVIYYDMKQATLIDVSVSKDPALTGINPCKFWVYRLCTDSILSNSRQIDNL